MVYAAIFGSLSSLLTVGFITLYNQGIKFFDQVTLMVLDVNVWPLVLLTVAGLLIGLIIRFLGQFKRLPNTDLLLLSHSIIDTFYKSVL